MRDLDYRIAPTDIYAEVSDLPGTEIAGMVLFNAVHNVLLEAEDTESLTNAQRKVVLRQIAKQLERIIDRYHLDHTVDLERYLGKP